MNRMVSPFLWGDNVPKEGCDLFWRGTTRPAIPRFPFRANPRTSSQSTACASWFISPIEPQENPVRLTDIFHALLSDDAEARLPVEAHGIRCDVGTQGWETERFRGANEFAQQRASNALFEAVGMHEQPAKPPRTGENRDSDDFTISLCNENPLPGNRLPQVLRRIFADEMADSGFGVLGGAHAHEGGPGQSGSGNGVARREVPYGDAVRFHGLLVVPRVFNHCWNRFSGLFEASTASFALSLAYNSLFT